MPNFNYNRIALGGRLTDEPELRQTQSGKPVANFRIAVGRRFKPQDAQEPKADFFNCTAWGATAETIARYFHKGSSIFVTGEMQCSKYTKKDGSEGYSWDVIVNEITFVESKAEASPQTAYAAAGSQTPTQTSNYPSKNQTPAKPPQSAPRTTPQQSYVPESYNAPKNDSEPRFEQLEDDGNLPF